MGAQLQLQFGPSRCFRSAPALTNAKGKFAMANGQLVRERACAQCGTVTISGSRGPPKRYCSDACKQKAYRTREQPCDAPVSRSGACLVEGCGRRIAAKGLCTRHYLRNREGRPLETNCEHCGQRTFRPRFCSVRCSAVARERRNGARPIAEVNAERRAAAEKTCPECKQKFLPSRHDKHSKGPQVFCSPSCTHAEAHRRMAIRRFVRAEAAVYRKWAIAARARQREAEAVRVCGCGTEMQRYARRCGPCAERAAAVAKQRYRQSPQRKAARRKGKAWRRAVERGVTAERFDPFEIFERDRWRCHMCGCKTPKRLRGTYENNAPELDHIVPLAAGGQHTRMNTACACRKCNGLKADKPLGQLRLVA